MSNPHKRSVVNRAKKLNHEPDNLIIISNSNTNSNSTDIRNTSSINPNSKNNNNNRSLFNTKSLPLPPSASSPSSATSYGAMIVEEKDRENPFVMLSAKNQSIIINPTNNTTNDNRQTSNKFFNSPSSSSTAIPPNGASHLISNGIHPISSSSSFDQNSNRDETFSRQDEWEQQKLDLIYGKRQWDDDDCEEEDYDKEEEEEEEEDKEAREGENNNPIRHPKPHSHSNYRHRHHHLLLKTDRDHSYSAHRKSKKLPPAQASVATTTTPVEVSLSRSSTISSGSSRAISSSSKSHPPSSRSSRSSTSTIVSPYSAIAFLDQIQSPTSHDLKQPSPTLLSPSSSSVDPTNSPTTTSRRQSLPLSAQTSLARPDYSRSRSMTVVNAAGGLWSTIFQRIPSPHRMFPLNEIDAIDSPLKLTDDDLETLGMSGSELLKHRVREEWDNWSGRVEGRESLVKNQSRLNSRIDPPNPDQQLRLSSSKIIQDRPQPLSLPSSSGSPIHRSSIINQSSSTSSQNHQLSNKRLPKFVHQIILSFDAHDRNCVQAIMYLRQLSNGIRYPEENASDRFCSPKNNLNSYNNENDSSSIISTTPTANGAMTIPKPKIVYKSPEPKEDDDEFEPKPEVCHHRSKTIMIENRTNSNNNHRFSRCHHQKSNSISAIMGSFSSNGTQTCKTQLDNSNGDAIHENVKNDDKGKGRMEFKKNCGEDSKNHYNGVLRRRNMKRLEQVVMIRWSDGSKDEFDPSGLELNEILRKCYCI